MYQKKSMMPIALMICSVLLISGCAGQSAKSQDGSSSLNPSDLAKCLAANGAKVYGASSCSHCQDQKALFGEEWGIIDYIECEVPDDPSAQNAECSKAGITAYPTWVFRDGQVAQGKRTMEELWQMAGCGAAIASPVSDDEMEDIAPEEPSEGMYDPNQDSNGAIEDTDAKVPAEPEEQSMTYQIDLDASITYRGGSTMDNVRIMSENTEHTVISTKKTIKRDWRGDFVSDGERNPIQISVEGYQEAFCVKTNQDQSFDVVGAVHGEYSTGPYEGTTEIDLEYVVDDQDGSDTGLRISFSQIEGLPTMPSATRLGPCPTESRVKEEALNARVNDLYDATSSIYNRIDEVNRPDEYGPFFSSIDGGTIDFSGTEPSSIVGYTNTWVGTLTVTRIS